MHRHILIICVLLALGWLGMEHSKAQEFTGAPEPEHTESPITVAMSFKRYDYMLFEPVYVEVEIRNTSSQDIILSSDDPNTPWISFLITDPRGKSVKRDRGAVYEAKLLKSQGPPLRFTIDITPYYLIRNPGEYRLRCVVALPQSNPVITDNKRFQIREGRKLFSTSRNYQNSNLTYSLMKFSPDLSNSYAYLRVEDGANNHVYPNTSLGDITDTNPQILFDANDNIHVLHIIGSGEYRYSRLSALGALQNQSKYMSAAGVPPRLMRMDDGAVLVAGGEKDTKGERPKLSASVSKTPGGSSTPVGQVTAPSNGNRSTLTQNPPPPGSIPASSSSASPYPAPSSTTSPYSAPAPGAPSSYAPPSASSFTPPSPSKPDAGIPSRTVSGGGSRSK